MVLQVQVIGVDQITTEPTVKFRCSTNDGESIFVGSDDVKTQGHVWQYKNQSWTRITDNLSNSFLSVNSIVIKDKTLYVGTGSNYFDYGKGQVWKNYGISWENTGLQFPGNANILIRNLLKVGDDIFAAGTAAYVYKLSQNSWTSVFPFPSSQLFNFVDLATDGENVYASIAGIDAFQYSGIFKYDNNSWNTISTSNFGVSSNQLISKLCWSNNKLYAGTFNQVSGCEIWKYENSSWSKINQNGFGFIGNFNVVDLKSINNKLIASIENHLGGTVWEFDELLGWSNITINSSTKYSSYLIESLGETTFLIGTQKINILPDVSSVNLYARQDLRTSGLHLFPDSSFNASMYLGNGRYRYIGANTGNPVVIEGTLEDPIQEVISPVEPFSMGAWLTNFDATGLRYQAILDKKPDALSGQLGMIFDQNVALGAIPVSGIFYYGGGVNFRDDVSGVTLYFYHTEEGYWTVPSPTGVFNPGGWAGNIRMAVSFDEGLTFYDCGSVIKSPVIPIPPDVNPIPLETFAGVRKVGDYLYGYYWSDASGTNPASDGITFSIARAPYTEVIEYALNKQVSPNWKKYYNGSFDQPGEGGLASNLFTNYLVPVRKHFNTYYSSGLDLIFNFLVNPLYVMDSNLYIYNFLSSPEDIFLTTSRDGFTFGYPQRITTSVNGYTNYFSVVASSTHYGNLADRSYIYGMTGPRQTFFSQQPISKLNLSSLPSENITRSFSEGKYSSSPNFKIFYKNNNQWEEVIPYTKNENNWKLSLPYSKTNAGWTDSYPIKQGREEVDLYFYIGDSLAADDAGSAVGFLESNNYSGLASSVSGCYTFRTVESPQTTGEFGPFTGYRFEEIRTGVNTNPVAPYWFGKAGADIVFLHKARQQSNNDVYVVKYGLGGAGWCSDSTKFDWSPRSGNGDLFISYINFLVIPALAVLKDSGKNPKFKGGIITLGTNYPSYINKIEYTKEQINLDCSGLVSSIINSFNNNNINTDYAKIIWIAPDRVRLGLYSETMTEPFKSTYLEYLDATVSSILNLSSIFNFASGYDPSAWASLSNTGDYGHPSTSGHIKIGETVFNNFFYTGP